MDYLGTEVRFAEPPEPGVYWAVLCRRGDERWVELLDGSPRRAGHVEEREGVWLGTHEGLLRTVLRLVTVEHGRTGAGVQRLWVRSAARHELAANEPLLRAR
jgi:hypothetical protein